MSMFLSHDNFSSRCIKSPIKFKLSSRTHGFVILVIYAASLLVSYPHSYYFQYSYDNEAPRCLWKLDDHSTLLYYTIFALLTSIVPLVVLTIHQTLSYRALKQASVSIMGNIRRISKMRKIFTMLVIVAALFLLLTTPMNLFLVFAWYLIVYDINFYLENENLILDINAALNLLLTVSSCMNPFIYARIHNKIASKLSIVRRACCKSNKNKVSEPMEMQQQK